MNPKKTLVLALLAAGLVLIGISFTSAWSSAIGRESSTSIQSEIKHDLKKGHGASGESWEQIDAKLRFDVHHPTSVGLEESFIVSATCHVVDVSAYTVTVGPRVDSKVPLDTPKKELLDRVNQLFNGHEGGTKPKVGIELLMAGAEIVPATPQTGQLQFPIYWSVRSRSGGSLQGFIRVKWLGDDTNPSERWGLFLDDDAFFTLQVTDSYWDFSGFSTWLARFIGTLLTIPGILMAIGSVFGGPKKSAEPARPRLILPDANGF